MKSLYQRVYPFVSHLTCPVSGFSVSARWLLPVTSRDADRAPLKKHEATKVTKRRVKMGIQYILEKQWDLMGLIINNKISIYINDIWVKLKLVCTTKHGNFDKKHDNTNNTQLILQVPYLQIKLYTIIATCWV